MKEKILHCFMWSNQDIINSLKLIKDTGFTSIQIMPIQPHKKINYNNYDEYYSNWWRYYQPTNIDFDDKDSFVNLCNKCHEYNIKVIVDVVLRHVASSDADCLKPSHLVDNDLLQYLAQPINCDDYNDRFKETTRCTGLPMLNYENVELQNKYYIPFLEEVLKYADGIRLDQAKHFSLPSENGTFFTNVINKLPKDKFIYGECINCRNDLLDEYGKYLYPLVANYEYGTNNNSVRFFESHDTNLSFLYTLSMNNNTRLNNWEQLLKQYDRCLYFSRRNDDTIFSDTMKYINKRY